MDIANDPRFFTGNVIDKRIAAFSCLSFVSGLMVQNAINESYGMKKDFDFHTIEGWSQAIGFALICYVLFANITSTYVGVAQPYHTYRLMTAGPAGFETAVAYYLDVTITSWRHLSVKMMLTSLPCFLISAAFRFVSKFARDGTADKDLPEETPFQARISGYVVWTLFVAGFLELVYVHWEHQRIFQDKYKIMWHAAGMGTVIPQVQNMMAPRARGYTEPSVDV